MWPDPFDPGVVYLLTLFIIHFRNSLNTNKYMNTTSKRNTITLAAFFAVAVVSAIVFAFPGLSHAAMISQQLDLGMTGSDVTSLQTFLAGNSAIYPEGIISGYFGSLTASAVSRFQSANGLSAVGRVGPQTLALINSLMGGGTSTNGGDVSAPIMNPETVTVTSNSATISWVTSEAAKDRVMYGTTWPFLYATAPSVSATGFTSTASIMLPSLQSHTRYYYTLESIDASGNIQWAIGKSLLTQ